MVVPEYETHEIWVILSIVALIKGNEERNTLLLNKLTANVYLFCDLKLHLEAHDILLNTIDEHIA